MKSDKPARHIELLAPAKNKECGIEAVNHGADAVYIGAPRFGARAAAGNSLEDIAELVRYAHLFNVRIYVAVNTILYDEELAETERMIWDLYHIGVDALIIQDMGITRLDIPPIPLHASTQMDNRTVEKVRFLSAMGFRQVVLARELSIPEIARIHSACPDTLLEVFIHGALCVSYSGQCYVSEACYGRSANRGECAQFCRLGFDMVDVDGKIIVHDKHLLSLKDMNQSENLEALLDAGASSLKIEGRLKDVSYVKNVTAYYRQKLDAIFRRRKEYCRATSGYVNLMFRPQPDKSFNRGFTDYFAHGRNSRIASFDTPKSLGEEVGTVKEIRHNYLTVESTKSFSNGDGICYLDEHGKLQGFRVNRAESNRLYPQEMPSVRPKTKLYRNFDRNFERTLQKKSAERKIALSLVLSENSFGITLSATDEDGNRISVTQPLEKQLSRTPQADYQRTQIEKFGNTPFKVESIKLELLDNLFVPASVLTDMRRHVTDRMIGLRRINYQQELRVMQCANSTFPSQELTYLGNVSNSRAKAFYHDHGVKRIDFAFEKKKTENAILMFCKHCLRYSMGWCPTHHHVRSPFREPYFLVSADGHRFRLLFDCNVCQMKVQAEK